MNAHIEGHKTGAKKIRAYRENLEVRLEGLADIQKEGRITPNNVFANTWLKKTACEGGDPADPEACRALEEYLVSKIAEEKLLHQTMSAELDSKTRSEGDSMMRKLNDGSAARQLRSDPDYQDILSDLKDLGELIDPEEVFHDLTGRMQERVKEAKSPLKRLQDERNTLIERFGEKPVSEDCARDITNLNILNETIRRAKTDPKFPPEAARLVIADLYRSPEKKSVHYTNIPSESETKSALKGLSESGQGKALGLEEMAEMANKNREAKKESQLNIG